MTITKTDGETFAKVHFPKGHSELSGQWIDYIQEAATGAYQRGFIEGQKAMRERATKEADYHWQRGHNPTRAIRNLPIKGKTMSDNYGRDTIITRILCLECGTPMRVSYDAKAGVKYDSWRNGDPTGARVFYNTIYMHPCKTCVAKLTAPATALAKALKQIGENDEQA